MKFEKTWLMAIRNCAVTIPGDSRIIVSKDLPHNLHYRSNVHGYGRRRAAVFIPLCNRNGEASVLLTVRSDNVGTHKGHVSFPGGHIEPNEGAVAAAMREMREEIGEAVGPLHCIGICQTIPAITGTLVTPVLGFLERDVADLSHLTPHEGEVASIFTRSIAQLISPGYKSFEKLSRPPSAGRVNKELQSQQQVTMPVFGAHEGKERIWGLTALMLDAALRNAVLPAKPPQ